MQPYEQLEQELTSWIGLRDSPVAVCSSGTAALHLALESLRIHLGKYVIVPDFAMIAVPRAVTLAGLKPMFVDCDETLNYSKDAVKKAVDAINPPDGIIAGMIAVHTYGFKADVEFIRHEIAPQYYRFEIVEDLAEAHGIVPHKYTAAACWSFYKNKVIAGEEGGAICFPHDIYGGNYEHSKLLRNMGFTLDHDFTHIPRGHNYRMSNAHASLILDSLHNVEKNLFKRWQIYGWYQKHCYGEWNFPRPDVPWVYPLRIRGMAQDVQNRVIRTLNDIGIPARHFFKRCSSQLEYRDCPVFTNGDSMASRMSVEGIYLPIQPDITTEESVVKAFTTIQSIIPVK